MAKKTQSASDLGDDKTYAFLGAFLTLIGFIIVMVTKKESKYAMYYAKHGLVLAIAWFIIAIASGIPFIGWFIIAPLGQIAMLVLWIITWLNALSGEEKKTPVISNFAEKINL